jgi:sugar lactone lactonase YvrE
MKLVIRGLVLIVVALIAYLTLWPVPVKPVAWEAQAAPGYAGQWAVNSDLAGLNKIDLKGFSGPEDVTSRQIDGKTAIFTTSHQGSILRIDPETGEVTEFAKTGGRPLGLEFAPDGNLIVADAMRGLLSISPAGEVTLLTERVTGGTEFLFTDDLDIAADGRVFFTDATTRFSAKATGDTLTASILDLMEHSSNGRLLMYDPATKQTTIVKEGFNFGNGVAMCPEDKCVFVADTGTYAVWRIWLEGKGAGQTDIVLTNLPGFPDNLNRAPDGTYWLGLTSPRLAAIDKLAAKPFMRKLVMRLPARFKPAPVRYGMVINFGFDGHILNQFQDPQGDYPTTTGVHDAGDGWLYITSLSAHTLGRKGWAKTGIAAGE